MAAPACNPNAGCEGAQAGGSLMPATHTHTHYVFIYTLSQQYPPNFTVAKKIGNGEGTPQAPSPHKTFVLLIRTLWKRQDGSEQIE